MVTYALSCPLPAMGAPAHAPWQQALAPLCTLLLPPLLHPAAAAVGLQVPPAQQLQPPVPCKCTRYIMRSAFSHSKAMFATQLRPCHELRQTLGSLITRQ
jgi:hypothetical protein